MHYFMLHISGSTSLDQRAAMNIGRGSEDGPLKLHGMQTLDWNTVYHIVDNQAHSMKRTNN